VAVDISSTGLWEAHQIICGAGTGNTLSATPRHSIVPGSSYHMLRTPGSLIPILQVHNSGSPTIPFGLFNIEELSSIINAKAVAGSDVWTYGAKFDTMNPFAVWWAQRDDRGTYAAGSVHAKASTAKSLVQLRQLIAMQDAVAMADMLTYAIKDGANNPVTWSTGQALPARTLTDVCFTLGPVYLDGEEITLNQGFTYTPGFGFDAIRQAGNPFCETGVVTPGGPSVTVGLRGRSTLDSLGITNIDGPYALTCFLRRLTPYGDRYADDETEHVKLTFAKVAVQCDQPPGGQINQLFTDTIRFNVMDPNAAYVTVALDQVIAAPA